VPVEAEAVAEPVVAESVVVEPVAAEPVVAAAPVAPEPEPAPEAVVPEPEPEPVMAAPSEPELPASAPAADIVEQPTWQITAPDSGPPTIAPETGPEMSQPVAPRQMTPETADPFWPSKPEWPALEAAAELLPFPTRLSRPEGGIEALWAASNQELIATPPLPGRPSSGIQPCVNCGLSLSATARFCRRCGTLQGG
jgi:hypothetical protein